MTDDNRNANHSGGQTLRDDDPLLELTRLFDMDSGANKDSPAASAKIQNTNGHLQSGGADDSDLPFLEASPQQQSMLNTGHQNTNVSSTPQNIDDDLDFLPNDAQQQPVSQKQEPDLPFNELYDVPSFTPQARSFSAPVETPPGFESEQFDASPDIPIAGEPDFPVDTLDQNYNSSQNEQLPADFNFFPEQDRQTPRVQNISSASTVNSLSRSDSPAPAANTTFTVSSEPMHSVFSDQLLSSAQKKVPMQQYPAFDETLFDKELENLLVNSPLAEEDELNVPAYKKENLFSNISNKTPGSVQRNANQYAANKKNLVSQSQVFNPTGQNYNKASRLNINSEVKANDSVNSGYTQHLQLDLAPLPYSPPVRQQTAEDNFLNGNDSRGGGTVDSNSQKIANTKTSSLTSQSTSKFATDNTVDPFGLEDLSTEKVIVNPPVHPNDSKGKFQPNNLKNIANTPVLPIKTQNIEQQSLSVVNLQQKNAQIPPQVQLDQSHLSKQSDNNYTAHFNKKNVASDQNVNDQNADTPPDVNTYKFADEIVETTEPVDVPEIPYPAEETTQKGDALENEFADVFNVGNKQETIDKLAEQEEFFADAYAQSGYNLKQNQADNNAAEPQYQSDDSYKAYENSDQNVSTENLTVADFQNQRRPKSLARKLITSGFALFIVVGGGYAATKYFMPSQEYGTSTVIHADNEPFKVPAEQNSTNNDTQNNQDVYNHANGTDDSVKDNQDKLVDRSETPEDLTALNNIPEGVDSYTDPSNVEDAIAAAANQTVPTREVQSVVVNPDGTISPSASTSLRSSTDNIENNVGSQMKPIEKVNASQTAANKPSANAKTQSESNTSTTDSELEKIINDDAQTNEENKNSSVAASGNAQNSMTGMNSVTTPTVKQQAQPVQTADVASQPPLNLAPKTATKAKSEKIAPMVSLGAGGYYVQIASQPTRESAVIALNKAKSSFGSLFGSLPLSIEPATIPGKGTYYRVRVQVGPRDNAVSICDSIKSQNGNCFVGK